MRARRFALVAGGGTGGHILPAVAVARALSEAHGAGSVELVGSKRGLDLQLVWGSGIPFTLLPGRGLQRKLSPSALAANVSSVAQLVAAFARALLVVVSRRPQVVVAMGGYACVAPSLAAKAAGIPVVLVNVDAVPGAANRLVARFAKAAAVAFEGTSLPRAVVTGSPVREEIAAARTNGLPQAAAREALGIPVDRRVVALVGGSLGARRLNEAGIALARRWEKRADLALYHVVGRRDFSWSREHGPRTALEGLWYRQVEYESRMAQFYRAADVVVSRAGANAIAELSVVGVPAVLVPLPGSPGDHQMENARILEHAGAAVVVPDEECDGGRLASELDLLLSDRPALDSMSAAAARMGRPDSLEQVVKLVEQSAGPMGTDLGETSR